MQLLRRARTAPLAGGLEHAAQERQRAAEHRVRGRRVRGVGAPVDDVARLVLPEGIPQAAGPEPVADLEPHALEERVLATLVQAHQRLGLFLGLEVFLGAGGLVELVVRDAERLAVGADVVVVLGFVLGNCLAKFEHLVLGLVQHRPGQPGSGQHAVGVGFERLDGEARERTGPLDADHKRLDGPVHAGRVNLDLVVLLDRLKPVQVSRRRAHHEGGPRRGRAAVC